MGDAQLELNKPKEAADLYAKAADHNANEYFSPGYLLKEATARELAKDNEGAVKAYDRIINDYPTAQEVAEARQYKAKLEAANKPTRHLIPCHPERSEGPYCTRTQPVHA